MRKELWVGLVWMFCGLWLMTPQASAKKASKDKKAKKEVLSLCTKGERVFFSCKMAKSGKLLSLCGAGKLTARKGYLQYRFGRKGKVELRYPKQKKGSQKRFGYNRYTRPQVTYLKVWFQNKGYKYTIEDDYHRGQTSQSLRLDTPRKRTIRLKCKKVYKSSLMSLEEIIPHK